MYLAILGLGVFVIVLTILGSLAAFAIMVREKD